MRSIHEGLPVFVGRSRYTDSVRVTYPCFERTAFNLETEMNVSQFASDGAMRSGSTNKQPHLSTKPKQFVILFVTRTEKSDYDTEAGCINDLKRHYYYHCRRQRC